MRKYLLTAALATYLLAPMPALAYASSYGYADAYQTRATYLPSTVHLDDDLVFRVFVGLIALVGVGAFIDLASRGSRSQSDLMPKESPEHYDQEASRTRAYARKLDAEATLAESQLRASLKQDELKEFQSFLQEKNSPRRRK